MSARLAMLLVGVTFLGACSTTGSEADPIELSATPLGGTPSPTPTPTATASPTPTPTASVSASPSPEPTKHDPTDTDIARFVASYQPVGVTDLEHVAIDVDQDGIKEVVFAWVRTASKVSHLAVAWWQDTEFEVTFEGDGGPAEQIDRIMISDINDDGRNEIALFQRIGASGKSATLWRAQRRGREDLDTMPAMGGCHDESSTYGVVGVTIDDRNRDGESEIYATCDDSPLPAQSWSTDVYEWRSGRYRYSRTQL